MRSPGLEEGITRVCLLGSSLPPESAFIGWVAREVERARPALSPGPDEVD